MYAADFSPINFSVLNETDVREEIIAPLLRLLGYKSGTKNNIIREQSLRYPRAYLGRKNKNKDPLLRGKADYICEVDTRIRWVIEAKDPNALFDIDEIEQAFSYAFHPEIRAVYFVLCNGRKIDVYATVNSPDAEPIFSLSYENFSSSFDKLKNILGPDSIQRDFPHINIDLGKPLANNLRSLVRFSSGSISYHSNSLGIKPLQEMTVSIIGGAAERDDDGKIVAIIKTLSPYRSMQELNKKLGLNQFEMFCSDEYISQNKDFPSQFYGQHSLILPAGEEILDLNTWNKIKMPINISCVTTTIAIGHLEKECFSGVFKAILDFKEMSMKVNLTGTFSVTLA